LKRPDHAVQIELTVPFYDCDPLAVVWHGRYFQYFELARTELLRSRALDVPELRDLAVRVYVSDVRCRYNAPLAYGESFQVTAWFSELHPLVKVAYEIFNVTKRRISARGHTRLALTDAEGRLLHEVPSTIRHRLPKLDGPDSFPSPGHT
jgi:acyl-CoA thioester hydrolase